MLSHSDVLQWSVTAHGPISWGMVIQGSQFEFWCTPQLVCCQQSLYNLFGITWLLQLSFPLAGNTRDSAASEEWAPEGVQPGHCQGLGRAGESSSDCPPTKPYPTESPGDQLKSSKKEFKRTGKNECSQHAWLMARWGENSRNGGYINYTSSFQIHLLCVD